MVLKMQSHSSRHMSSRLAHPLSGLLKQITDPAQSMTQMMTRAVCQNVASSELYARLRTLRTTVTAGASAALIALCSQSISTTAQAAEGDYGTQIASTRLQSTHISESFKLGNVLEKAPLSNADAQLYKRIFKYQEAGHIRKASTLIRKLHSKSLMGYVLAQRYLHPTAYRSKYRELSAWLASYADHPDADRIYKLALKKRPRKAAYPKRPSARKLSGTGGDVTTRDKKYITPNKSNSARKKAKLYRRKIARNLRRGILTKSIQVLSYKDVKRVINRTERDRLRAEIAAGFFYDGQSQKALNLAQQVISRSGAKVSNAYWIAGLSSWKLGKYQKALGYFDKLTKHDYAGDWTKSAGAYWASRAAAATETYHDVSYYLNKAAAHPRTFYGQIAVQALGTEQQANWSLPPVKEQDVDAVLDTKAGHRALALLQIGYDDYAEQELRGLYRRATPAMRRVFLGIATKTDMPAFAMRLAGLIAKNESIIADAALYPLPHWEPRTGFQLDRALLFALMRQESGFLPNAKSYAGARGLMQVMPGTARFIARSSNIKISSGRLYEPETNLALGQAYIHHLMDFKESRKSLFHILASYNAGPGNVQKWNRKDMGEGDPLLFIESIPLKETRDYIERVFTNYWMYRQQMGQKTPSLQSVSSNDWPRYIAMD